MTSSHPLEFESLSQIACLSEGGKCSFCLHLSLSLFKSLKKWKKKNLKVEEHRILKIEKIKENLKFLSWVNDYGVWSI